MVPKIPGSSRHLMAFFVDPRTESAVPSRALKRNQWTKLVRWWFCGSHFRQTEIVRRMRQTKATSDDLWMPFELEIKTKLPVSGCKNQKQGCNIKRIQNRIKANGWNRSQHTSWRHIVWRYVSSGSDNFHRKGWHTDMPSKKTERN